MGKYFFMSLPIIVNKYKVQIYVFETIITDDFFFILLNSNNVYR